MTDQGKYLILTEAKECLMNVLPKNLLCWESSQGMPSSQKAKDLVI